MSGSSVERSELLIRRQLPRTILIDSTKRRTCGTMTDTEEKLCSCQSTTGYELEEPEDRPQKLRRG